MTITLADIAAYLDEALAVVRFGADQNGVYRASQRPVQRIGLALEPWPALGGWVAEARLDALVLHRPWQLDAAALPGDIGVLAYHLAFDAALTFGDNPRLAVALGLRTYMPFGGTVAVPLGMVGDINPTEQDAYLARLAAIFGAVPALRGRVTGPVRRVALVGALTDGLVRAAALDGVQLYITGQFRVPAARAQRETGLAVAAVGHAAGERWGLRALGAILRERWADLEVCLAEPA